MIADRIHALVQRAQQGDKDAWGQLVARIRPELVHYAERLVGRGRSFEDLTHEVLLRAWDWLPSLCEWQRRRRYDPETAGGSADHHPTPVLERPAQETVVPHLPLGTSSPNDSTGANGVAEPAGKDLTPSKDFDAREKARFIQEALKSLSAQDRQIVELRFFEKWDFGQIGAHLGLDESTVRYHLHKCLKQLQPKLKGLMPRFIHRSMKRSAMKRPAKPFPAGTFSSLRSCPCRMRAVSPCRRAKSTQGIQETI
jgi:RNA polymerase sigma factor (sigma-70 family)